MALEGNRKAAGRRGPDPGSLLKCRHVPALRIQIVLKKAPLLRYTVIRNRGFS